MAFVAVTASTEITACVNPVLQRYSPIANVLGVRKSPGRHVKRSVTWPRLTVINSRSAYKDGTISHRVRK